ncbi:MAG: hypothetical protein ACXADU_20350 [Promethearchaeota archaeon]
MGLSKRERVFKALELQGDTLDSNKRASLSKHSKNQRKGKKTMVG